MEEIKLLLTDELVNFVQIFQQFFKHFILIYSFFNSGTNFKLGWNFILFSVNEMREFSEHIIQFIHIFANVGFAEVDIV